jgi:SMC interacting uncharacterized protein involved in chromosome segregation
MDSEELSGANDALTDCNELESVYTLSLRSVVVDVNEELTTVIDVDAEALFEVTAKLNDEERGSIEELNSCSDEEIPEICMDRIDIDEDTINTLELRIELDPLKINMDELTTRSDEETCCSEAEVEIKESSVND